MTRGETGAADATVELSSGSDIQSTLAAALAAAQPKDPIGILVARARVAAGLFESSKASGVGRFQLLDRLAAGGMGVIYAAYDPQLERAVAVKLVYLPGNNGGDAMAEAKALARLSHPNVVTIFDYGFADDHLYIVMELVLGVTLRRWVKGRSQREIVKAYHQAGDALAAAHAAALIHRDFKPDNAIMGVDGRVRVVDFGLACAVAEPGTGGQVFHPVAGTRAYMAPEQVTGGPITVAADQYGFCTALQDALQGEDAGGSSPVIPRWLQAVIERGRAVNPADRFASMVDLLRALAKDPMVGRRRRLSVAAVIATGILVVAGGLATLKAKDRPCDAGEARLAAAWGALGQEAALSRVAQASPYGASLRPRLQGDLADHSRRWTAQYHDACWATVNGVQSQLLGDRRMACLERGRSALRSVAQIVSTIDGAHVADLPLAVHALPDPDSCDDLTALLSDSEPPPSEVAGQVATLRSRIDQARVQIAAGQSQQALPATDAIVRAARALSYHPLLSEALLEQGHAMLNTDQRVGAIAPLTESFTLAFHTGLSSLAVEAWARRAWSQGTSMGGEQALSGLEVVQAIAGSRSTSAFSRALLYNNVGCVQLALEKRAQARVSFERAAAEGEAVTGPGAAELLNVSVNLGLVIDDPDQRDQVLANGAARRAALLGADHPETLDALWLRGAGLIGYAQAIELLVPTCTALEVHGVVRAQRCWMEVAYLRGELNDPAGAVSALQRATSMVDATVPPSPLVTPYLHFWQGNAAAAAGEFAATLDALRPRQSEPWWDRFERAELQLGLGRALRSSGRPHQAKKALLSGLQGLSEVAAMRLAPNADRRLSRARAELAQVLVTLHESRSRIADLAGPAAGWLRRAGGLEEEIAELERLGHGDAATTGRQGKEIGAPGTSPLQ